MSKLEDAFNLPEAIEDISEKASQISKSMKEDLSDDLAKIDDAIGSMDVDENLDMEAFDKDMDEIASKTMTEFEELMMIGKDVEIRHAGEIFSAAAQMIKISHDLKLNKMNARLKKMELKLRKQRNDQIQSKQDSELGDEKVTTGSSASRDDIISMIDKWKKEQPEK